MAKDSKGHGSTSREMPGEARSASYRSGRRAMAEHEEKVQGTSDALQKFPKSGSMGLTPDHVKNSPEFKKARAEYATAAARAGQHSKAFIKEHGKQYKADEQDRRKAIAAGKQLLGRTIDLTPVRATTQNKKY